MEIDQQGTGPSQNIRSNGGKFDQRLAIDSLGNQDRGFWHVLDWLGHTRWLTLRAKVGAPQPLHVFEGCLAIVLRIQLGDGAAASGTDDGKREIGRASCRERVE